MPTQVLSQSQIVPTPSFSSRTGDEALSRQIQNEVLKEGVGIEYATAAAQGQVLRVKIVPDFQQPEKIELMFLERITPCYPSPDSTPPKLPISTPSSSPLSLRSPPTEVGGYNKGGEKREWECLAGIPADAPLGKQKIEIWKNNNRPRLSPLPLLPAFAGTAPFSPIKGEGIFFSEDSIPLSEIEIVPSFYPTEPLHLSAEKKSLLSKKGREKEVKKIRRVMDEASLTKEKFWNEKAQMPLAGKIESSYGERRILDGKLRPGFHRGVDIGAKEGTPILAMSDGKVLLAEEFSEEGKMVMVNHGQGVISAYLHLSEILVKPKKMVKKGDVIGKVGSTGVSNSPHLHLGIYIHGTPVDPLYFLKSAFWLKD